MIPYKYNSYPPIYPCQLHIKIIGCNILKLDDVNRKIHLYFIKLSSRCHYCRFLLSIQIFWSKV